MVCIYPWLICFFFKEMELIQPTSVHHLMSAATETSDSSRQLTPTDFNGAFEEFSRNVANEMESEKVVIGNVEDMEFAVKRVKVTSAS